MFSRLTWLVGYSASQTTNPDIDMTSLKNKAITEAIAFRSQLIQTACNEFKTAHPSQPVMTFDEKQQFFNPWIDVFNDALLAILYLPRALTLCEKALETMRKLAQDAAKETCDVSQRNLLNEQFQRYQSNYDDLGYIDLALHGRRWINNGMISIQMGNQRLPYNIDLHPFDLTSLALHQIEIDTQPDAVSAIQQIDGALQTIRYNYLLLTKNYQHDIEMIFANALIRMKPIYSQLAALEKIATVASEPTATPDLLEKQFILGKAELHSIQIIRTYYGMQNFGCNNLAIQFGNRENTIRIQLPITDCELTGLNNATVMTPFDAKSALSLIKKIKCTCMQSPCDTWIMTNYNITGEDSDEEAHLQRLMYG